jgi:polar amino acid transport system substrate-binding protein
MPLLLPIAPLLLAAAVSASDLEALVYVTEDYPPENYVEHGELKGYAVEILKAVWRRLGTPERAIEVLPWARAYYRAKTGSSHVLFAIARTPEREAEFKWVGPIHRVRQSLFGVAGRAPAVRSVAEAAGYRVGVINEDIGGRELVRAGFPEPRLVKVGTLRQLLLMLQAGRLDLVCSSANAVRKQQEIDPSLRLDLVPLVAVGEVRIHFAFSPSTPDAVVTAFQAALDAIEPERRAILKRYGLTEPGREPAPAR